MKEFPKESIDSIVTDPPYGLNFMGKSWDDFEPKEYQNFCEDWGNEALRVLKPGGYLLAFSGTRTYHRMVTGLEDAGFTIKDQIDWIYGSGFPKSHDISKAIDEHFDKKDERKKIGVKTTPGGEKFPSQEHDDNNVATKFKRSNGKKEAPATSEAEKWDEWGTALKPSHEPVVVAQKPRESTYAENVLKWGVGGLNIDACRIDHNEPIKMTDREEGKGKTWNDENTGLRDNPSNLASPSQKGRWPANVVLDPVSAEMMDEQSGERKSGFLKKEYNLNEEKANKSVTYGDVSNEVYSKVEGRTYGDSGGASRFFYSAKAHKSERNAGLENIEKVSAGEMVDREEGSDGIEHPRAGAGRTSGAKNDIATLKPINLMRWLVKLVTPKDGTVLDPFAGSGTTGCAAVIEGFNYILIEKRERFANVIAPKRVYYWSDPNNWDDLKEHEELENPSEVQSDSLDKYF